MQPQTTLDALEALDALDALDALEALDTLEPLDKHLNPPPSEGSGEVFNPPPSEGLGEALSLSFGGVGEPLSIGIFGGSFNPIHNGHIALCKAFLAQCNLDEVWLMVSPQNPLKINTALLDDEQRFRLAQKAIEDEAGIKACDYEFHLPRPSYTWNTLQSLSNDYPHCRFTLLIGGDNWACFDKWYRSEDILNNYKIAVYPRSGSEIDAKQLPPNVWLINTPLFDISSTEIRQRVVSGLPISGMVPENIQEEVNLLYRSF
jgi:nicotinate-nucleotide adenylyltransferase